jgi:DedD protein
MTPLGTLPADEATDTEITLGTGKMLALFFGLVILCAIFFGMGFTMGKNSVRTPPELLPSPSTSPRSSAANRTASVPTPVQQQAKPEQSQSVTSSTQNSGSSATSQSASSTSASSQEQAAPSTLAPGQAYYVQVAAVSKQEDAEALVESLKGRQYSAFIANQGSDKLFRVQVGPFTDIKEAEDMRSTLVSDGYNPILKK